MWTRDIPGAMRAVERRMKGGGEHRKRAKDSA
jgi:hypothetical protein